MICVTDLTKRYGETLALDRLTLEIPGGSVFGLLGPNGAGKTTLLRLIMGFAFPDSGQVDRAELKPDQIGYLPERAFYPQRFTIRSYLLTIGKLAGLRGERLKAAVGHRLEQIGLDHVSERRLGACSRGMLQRLGLAQALIANPPVVLLDEPVLGLDPAAQKFIREQITTLYDDGKTVLLSSHHLDEVTRVCTHVAVINQGQLVRAGTLESMLAPRPQVTIVCGSLPQGTADRMLALSEEIAVEQGRIDLKGSAVDLKARVLGILLETGVDIQHLSEQHATLEEIYMEATGG
jgi:ABC-2 type transport system ATP-binding protein